MPEVGTKRNITVDAGPPVPRWVAFMNPADGSWLAIQPFLVGYEVRDGLLRLDLQEIYGDGGFMHVPAGPVHAFDTMEAAARFMAKRGKVTLRASADGELRLEVA